MADDYLNRLAIGGAFLNQRSEDDGVAAVRRAIELGVLQFDTSPAYCDGRSQAIIGQALDDVAGPCRLATKLGYLAARAEHRTADALWRQLESNLALLRCETIDLLQIHEADFAHWWSDDPSEPGRLTVGREYDFDGAPIVHVLRAARDQGICRRIGVTGNSAPEMAWLVRALADFDVLLTAFGYDLLHREARRELIPLAKTKRMAVRAGGVLQCGRLAEVHPEWLSHPPKWMMPSIRHRYRRLYAIQQDCGLSLVEMTIRYLLADDDIDQIIIGVASPSQVEHAARSASHGPLPAQLYQQIELLGETQ